MNISFYKNLEFMNKYYRYNIDDSNNLGTYYVDILNEYDYIVEWLETASNMLIKNETDYLELPSISLKNKANRFMKIIEINLYDIFEKEKQDLKNLEEKIFQFEFLHKNGQTFKVDISELDRLKELQKSKIDRIIHKKSLIFKIEESIKFIKKHRNKVDYYILKEKLFKDNTPPNIIANFFSDKIELPSYSKELYYEDNNYLRFIKTIYSNLRKKALNQKDYDELLKDFFKNAKLDYIEKYEISQISELMNVYYNKIISNNIPLKKCKNCGKYYIAHNKQIYCDNPSPQNMKKTCRLLSDDMKAKNDKLYEIYRKTYKTQHNKLERNIKAGNIPELKLRERFAKWNEAAILQKEKCKTPEEYLNWYNTSLNWIEDYKKEGEK